MSAEAVSVDINKDKVEIDRVKYTAANVGRFATAVTKRHQAVVLQETAETLEEEAIDLTREPFVAPEGMTIVVEPFEGATLRLQRLVMSPGEESFWSTVTTEDAYHYPLLTTSRKFSEGPQASFLGHAIAHTQPLLSGVRTYTGAGEFPQDRDITWVYSEDSMARVAWAEDVQVIPIETERIQ